MARKPGIEDVGFEAIAKTTETFANNFLNVVVDDNPGNLITSPLSAQVVLAMAAYGARGRTADQMRSVLLIPSDDELGLSGYQSIIRFFNVSYKERNPSGLLGIPFWLKNMVTAVKKVELRMANKVFTGSQFAVKSTYKELTAQKFLSESQALDFSDGSAAASAINNWCEEQTNKRIKNMVEPDTLHPDTTLVLVNAVYFKGLWKNKFNPNLTKDLPFHIDENSTKNVPTMFIKDEFRFGDLPELKARFIELPYQGLELSMIIILPDEISGLKTVIKNLNLLNLRMSLENTWHREVELFLPKFRIETTLDLKGTLEKLGMTDIFTNKADFSGIAEIPLKVNKIIQKAFIEVNEEGSEAAAATTYGMLLSARPITKPKFKVDRPYHYTIYHNKTGISLFTGIVEHPGLHSTRFELY